MATSRTGTECSYCKKKPIKHTRYVCLVCKNHNLCNDCSSLKRVTGLHQSYHPTQKVPPKSQRLQDAMLYCCPLCGDQGYTGQSLVRHVEQLHLKDRKLVYCPICVVFPLPTKVRSAQYDLLVHLYGDHPELSELAQCVICSSSLVRYGCLICENYQLCSECRLNRSFSKDHRPYHPLQPIPALTVNRANLDQKIVFVCPYCGREDLTVNSLASHCRQQHSSDASAVRCPICIVRRVPGGFGTLLNSKERGQLLKHLQVAHNWTMAEECSICIDKLSAGSHRNLSCGHSFHVKCIAQWLVTNTSCPICRTIVR